MWDGSKLYTRNGNVLVNPPEVIESLRGDFADFPLDGELCGKSWGETASAVKRMTPLHGSGVLYHVFDCTYRTAIPLTARKHLLAELFSRRQPKMLVLVPWDSLDDPIEAAQNYIGQGYEGAMLKLARSPYFAGQRSLSWLKVKFAKETDATIEGAVSGEGRLAATLGALIVRDAAGQQFKVGGGFTDSERDQLWALQLGGKLAGLTVTLIYQEDRNIKARFPRFVRLREDL